MFRYGLKLPLYTATVTCRYLHNLPVILPLPTATLLLDVVLQHHHRSYTHHYADALYQRTLHTPYADFLARTTGSSPLWDQLISCLPRFYAYSACYADSTPLCWRVLCLPVPTTAYSLSTPAIGYGSKLISTFTAAARTVRALLPAFTLADPPHGCTAAVSSMVPASHIDNSVRCACRFGACTFRSAYLLRRCAWCTLARGSSNITFLADVPV